MLVRLLQIGTAIATAVLLVIPTDAADPVKPGANVPLEYNRDVRPILAENCFACHGADSAARKAKLRLDDREIAIEKGAIAPGNLDDSGMIERILLPDSDELAMPPKTSHKSLKPEQKETLKRWIKEGAKYQPHWSFIAPKPIAVPVVKSPWVRNPIDAFVLEKLKANGMEPNPEADRRTLIRRVAYDLTGLPPDPKDVAALAKDSSPDWYEKYVDKLLATPQWGEHRGRYWLDYVRYADTHGIHFDNYREMWSYRDWVIKAFNRNQPFDQFTVDQLAGDLVPNPTIDQQVATGFNRCNITTNEGGAINEEYLVLYTRDRTEAANQVFMGLTAGCAVCHDHKFDPISAKEFYSMAAFFNNTTQIAMDGNIFNTPPIIPVPRDEDRAEWVKIRKEISTVRTKMAWRRLSASGSFNEWKKTATPTTILDARSDKEMPFYAWFDEGAGEHVRYVEKGKPRALTLPSGGEWKPGPTGNKALSLKPPTATVRFPTAGDFDGSKPFSAGLWVQIPQRGQTGGVLARMTIDDAYKGWDIYLENDKFAVHLSAKWPQDGVKITAKTGVNVNLWHHAFVTYDGSRTPGGLKLYLNGELQAVDVFANDKPVSEANLKTVVAPKESFHTNAPLTLGKRTNGQTLKQIHVNDLRLYERTLTATEVAYLAKSGTAAATLAKAEKRTPKESEELFGWWLNNFDKPFQEIQSGTGGLFAKEAELKTRGTIAHVSAEKMAMPEAYILSRGDYDKRKEKVGPDTPKALPPFPADLPKNRLGFAKWLLQKDHPLTARVTVNRFWQELFGAGLVRTPGDFGTTGDLPTHPELLDWLALDFQKDWDVKRFYKMLVLSNVYQQSAAVAKEKLEKDPANKLLGRGPRFRMDAEMIRDTALAASGLLVPKIGGPSVRPYQPDGVWEAVAMIGSDTRDYRRDKGENLYRRSMYTFWKRAAPPASMEVLNAPNRETCAMKRERTNTPLQALLTLNDVQFVEAARVLAEKAMSAGGKDDGAVLSFMTERLIARSFSSDELKIVNASLSALRAEFKKNPDEAKKLISFGESKADAKQDASELAAWTMLANQVMNLDEVLNK